MSTAPKVFATREQKQTLCGLIDTQAEIFGSNLSFLNLEHYKTSNPKEWEARLKIIRQICLRTLSQKLDGNSALVDFGESFVVLFFNNYGNIQRKVMDEIAQQIDQAIKSHDKLSGLDIACTSSTLKPEQLKGLLDAQLQKSVEEAEALSERNRRAHSDVLYQAVVAPGQKATIALNCMPRVLIESSKKTVESRYLVESEQTKQIDIQAFEHALSVAFKMSRKKDARRIIFSINFNNLKVPKFRKEYEHALKQSPRNTLERLIPKLVRVPLNTPPSTIENTIVTIRHYFQYLAMEAVYSKRDQSVFVEENVNRTITSLFVPKVRHYDDDQLVELKARLRRACVATHSRILGHGIETVEDWITAQRLGIDFVCGGAIHEFGPPADVPVTIDPEQNIAENVLVQV